MRVCAVALLLPLLPLCLPAQRAPHPAPKTPSAPESKAAQAFAAAAGDPVKLRALLGRMPKGADLHVHFSGAVYAETFLNEARADLMCVDPVAKSLAVNVGTTRSIPPQPVCGEGRRRVEDAFSDQTLYDTLIDWFSMRSFVPSAGLSGHDQFFATFDRFDPTHTAGARHGGEWLDDIASLAAAENQQYIEIMHTPGLGPVFAAAQALAWPSAAQTPTLAAFHQDISGTGDGELAAARATLLANPEFGKAVAADQAEFAKILRDRHEREHCGTPNPAPACAVRVRFLFQVLRANAPSITFAQILLGFELVQRQADERGPLSQGEPQVVGINLVQPEDSRLAMAEYTRQMRMVGYLHGLYPRVHIALHAGELVEGLVPPEGLRFHIRQAVEIAHAERIGHGVDIMDEDDAIALLRLMADRHIMAEINLTSNDGILGIAGIDHPLPFYREAGVPVALSTDDQGVSRIDLTHEYVRAAMDFHLGYAELKQMARTSLEHAFLEGASLWRSPDVFTDPVAACGSHAALGTSSDGSCQAFLQANPRAAEQWELERRFKVFESSFP